MDDTYTHCTFNYAVSVFPIWIAASAKVEAVPHLCTTVISAQALGSGVFAVRMQMPRAGLGHSCKQGAPRTTLRWEDQRRLSSAYP